MALPEYLFMCCLFIVCPSPNLALRVLLGSIGSAHVDSTYSNKLADEAHGPREFIGLLKEPVTHMAVHISNDKALIKGISSSVGDTEIIKPQTNQDLDIDKAHRKAITKHVLGNDAARLEPKSFTVSDSEFIDPPAYPDPDMNKAHIKPTTKPGLSLSDNEAPVEPKNFTVSDSEFIRPLNNPHSDFDKTHIKPTMRPSLSVDNELLKPPTNPVLIVKKAHIEPTIMPVLGIFDKTHRKPISIANGDRSGAHRISGVTIIARNRHISMTKSGETNFAVTKDGNDRPFLPSPDCCYLKNALDENNNKSPEQPTTLVHKNRVH